jgi:hypothetical protein
MYHPKFIKPIYVKPLHKILLECSETLDVQYWTRTSDRVHMKVRLNADSNAPFRKKKVIFRCYSQLHVRSHVHPVYAFQIIAKPRSRIHLSGSSMQRLE